MSTDDDFELVRGSGNVFRDFGYPNAEVLSAKSKLAAEIIAVIGNDDLSAEFFDAHPGMNAEELIRIRRASLSDISIDRLVEILSQLGQSVEIELFFRDMRTLSAAQ
ncbi:putative XRE-type DNA-binding protein [Rhizobium sp. SG_E_25_P2]|uniref:XRE family transcriptional regulator n=1 Tax=Rhizobium sp. SG_E_25_P2 TaxID=2879942 RepID=UPI0024768EE6|nr:XRE family transcriptional regulator [Rhizobium sp. SG_E_25_P2]MDH6267133.1 putative XRE-type DNA-binding protein [Rhizobium sp. SG_E_25_P2]